MSAEHDGRKWHGLQPDHRRLVIAALVDGNEQQPVQTLDDDALMVAHSMKPESFLGFGAARDSAKCHLLGASFDEQGCADHLVRLRRHRHPEEIDPRLDRGGRLAEERLKNAFACACSRLVLRLLGLRLQGGGKQLFLRDLELAANSLEGRCRGQRSSLEIFLELLPIDIQFPTDIIGAADPGRKPA